MFEVGQFYLWDGDVVTPCFTPEANPEQREYAENGFMMQKGHRAEEYKKGIITPEYKGRCECIHVDPVIFNVDRMISPLFEEDVKYKQFDSIKAVLRNLGCNVSDLSVQAVAEVAIPHNLRDMPVTEDVVLKSLIEYVESEVGDTYGGSAMGYSDHQNKLTSILTILFGHKVAYAIMQLNDTGKVRVEYQKNKFVAYYEQGELEAFLNSVGNAVGARTSAADSMLQDILDMAKSGVAKSADADDIITFTAWYQELKEDGRELIRMANPELAEAAAHNDRTTMLRYGTYGLRQTMWLIMQATPLSCDTRISEFYDWMYKHISAEGWNRLSLEFKELFKAVCNRSSIMGDEEIVNSFKEQVGKAMAVLEKYYNRNGDYCS